MSDDDGTSMVAAEVSDSTKELAMKQLDHGELTEMIRDLVSTVAHGGGWDRTDVIDKRINEREATISNLRNKRREIDASIEAAENELRELQIKRKQIDTKADKVEGALIALERRHRQGQPPHIHEEHNEVLHISREFGVSPGEIIDRLKERNPDLPNLAFQPFDQQRRKKWHGLEQDRAALPVEEREEKEESDYLL